MSKIHQIKVTTLTPVSIGGDESLALSPYKDYVFGNEGKTIHYVNQRALESSLAADPNLINEFVKGIRDGMDNNRSSFDLSNFLEKKLNFDLSDFSKKEIPNWGLAVNDKQHISPIEKTAGLPYLSGSSLKGAIRTTLLYDWLVASSYGEQEMKTIYNRIDRLSNLKREISNLRRNRDYRRIKDLEREEKRLENGIFEEESLFGTIKDKFGQDSRRIAVSDSDVVKNGLVVVSTERIRLKSGEGKSTIPSPREALFTEESFNFSVKIDAPLQHKALKYLEGEKSELLQTIRDFSTDCISDELQELKDAKAPEYKNQINSLIKFYEDLNDRAQNGETFMRIGFGKTIWQNSLILALYNGGGDRGKKLFETYHRMFLHKRSRKGGRYNGPGDFYPVTRTVTKGGLPLGWLKLE